MKLAGCLKEIWYFHMYVSPTVCFMVFFFHKGVDQFFIFGGGMQKEGGEISKGAEPTEGDTIMFNGNNNISNSVFALHSFFVTCY